VKHWEGLIIVIDIKLVFLSDSRARKSPRINILIKTLSKRL